MTFVRTLIVCVLLACTTACSSLSHLVGSKPIARNIDDAAIELNNAHARSINGVIAVNVLRSRDRWPTGYTTLSGVRFSPTTTVGGTLLLDPLGIRGDDPVGDGREAVERPRAASNFSTTGTLETGAQYSVNPFAEQDNSESLYSRDQSEGLFRQYYEGGWPPTVVLPLFLDSVANGSVVCRIDGDGELAKYLNNPLSQIGKDGNELNSDLIKFRNRYNISHPCHRIFEDFGRASMDALPTEWRYHENQNYDCKGNKCIKVDTGRRTSIRRGLADEIKKVDSQRMCLPIDNSSSGLMQDLLRGETEEGLGAKITAINSATGREVVMAHDKLRLCKSLPSGRLFYVKSTDQYKDESNTVIVQRLFDAYQDHALEKYLLEKKVDRSDLSKPEADDDTALDPDYEFGKSACYQQLIKIRSGNAIRAPKCEIRTEDFQFLLKKFVESQSYERPFTAVNFRSFDDMVHFVGETLRLPEQEVENGRKRGLCIERHNNGTKKDSKPGKCKRTLFNITKRRQPEIASEVFTGHGVKVVHAGETWYALPELNLKDVVAGRPSDRTGTVLSILSQIYLLNQSSEFLEAPDNVLIQ